MEVTVKQAKGATLIAKGNSNHWVVMDTLNKIGGNEGGSTPMEMILMGLGGCTSIDVISLLKKMRVNIDDLSVNVSAERKDDHPKVFSKIHMDFNFFGEDLDLKKIKKAVGLSSDKYCSVTAMLSKTAEMSYKININPEN